MALEAKPVEILYPEIGSRAFDQIVVIEDQPIQLGVSWNVVQEGRYRYLVSQSDEIAVRMVLSEYIAAEVAW
jgi:hypothetical protein